MNSYIESVQTFPKVRMLENKFKTYISTFYMTLF